MAETTGFAVGAAVKVYGWLGKVEIVASDGKRLFVRETATRAIWVAAKRVEAA